MMSVLRKHLGFPGAMTVCSHLRYGARIELGNQFFTLLTEERSLMRRFMTLSPAYCVGCCKYDDFVAPGK